MFPRKIDDITPEWLSEVLGRPVTAVTSGPVGIGLGLVGALYRLKVTYNGGDGPAITEEDITGAACAMEDAFHAMTMAPNTASILGALADLAPTTLAVMHGSSYRGDGAAALRQLASYCAAATAT